MDSVTKAMLSYTAWGGALIMLLTFSGNWALVDAFLVQNKLFGTFLSGIFLIFAYIYYDSQDKVSKIKFEEVRKHGAKTNKNGVDQNGE